MSKNKTVLEYWQDYIKGAHPLIKEWLKKENHYLKKRIKRGSVVLDVGCGVGRSIQSIVKIAKRIVGIDSDKKLCPLIREVLSKYPNVKFLCEDAERMSFPAESFDYIICMGNTFGDFGKKRDKILEKMRLVLKKRGVLIVSVYSEKALPVRLKEYRRIGIKIKKIEDGIVYTKDGLVLEQFSEKDLQRIFSRAGFKVKIYPLNLISYICEATISK